VIRSSSFPRPILITDEATWFKDAIIYELRTRSFYDSNDDGIGDFRGLTSKLDYLQDLGVTAIWLLPFYPSPGRDDGYDISEYCGIHPELGTLADFEELMEEAHRRGLRVITELVLNHTSDQHPWFQRARRAPAGSALRDFYVWSKTTDRYKDARIIFKDFEPSNWTWDEVAQGYYWHRFYSHQPDLNFENPAVQEALLGAVDFWLGKGVDGLRLDAVPYLYEADGTNCENLPPTHVFLKKLRAHVDAKFENRMLLAEANQWPEDAAAYFGQGDECHMNFHFPLMPRMFMSIHMEDRLPLIDIFAQTPEIHANCQWALFLRNHDELTLEMVTDEERDYMYRAYARQNAMRINLGIRRRLAPLVGNNRRKIELLNGLLFSLPGTPVLYYGDEIGMGDNVYLGDRNGVRTPMQWSMDRNAGFSKANPQRLILPLVIDPEYHFESLNVENQQQNPTSLLWWMKRLIALRRRFAAFGRGTISFLSPANSRVLAFVRELGPHDPRAQGRDESVLVVANLSRFVQYAELDLAKYEGSVPVELFGKSRFPVVRREPYLMTLGPHSFYWFELERPGVPEERFSAPHIHLPSFECASIEELLRSREIEDALASFLEVQPWFEGGIRPIKRVEVTDVFRLGYDAPDASVFLTLVLTEYTGGDSETYVLPLGFVPEDHPAPERARLAIVEIKGGVKGQGAPIRGTLVDALEDASCARLLLRALTSERQVRGRTGELSISPLVGAPPTEDDFRPHAKRIGDEQHDTTLRYADRFMLKVFRRLEESMSSELEMERLLASPSSRSLNIAPCLESAVELVRPQGEPLTIGLLHACLPHADTGWTFTLEELRRYYDRVLARAKDSPPPPLPPEPLLDLTRLEPPQVVAEMIGDFRDAAGKLGRKVAELHLVLASSDLPGFLPEPYSTLDRRSKYQSMRNLTGRVLRLLRERSATLSAESRRAADHVLASEGEIYRRCEPLLKIKTGAMRIRVHGDLHLGHSLYTGREFVLTGMGGERDTPLAARQRKRSPLRDLASMVRSFDLAATKLLLDPARVREADVDAARPWASHWTAWIGAAFLNGYFAALPPSSFLYAEREGAAGLFDVFILERALYQLEDQLVDRRDPASAAIPLVAIARILEVGGP
jgi:maltose alpha-D-glucosyltransferase / alpha-amylase